MIGGGCREPERPPIVWVGDHVQVGTDLDIDDWCPGTLPLLDSHAGRLRELFDVPADHVINYYLYPTAVDQHGCLEKSVACFVPDEGVVTTDLFELHEIVHAVQLTYGGMPHFFAEGGASYWGWHPGGDIRGLDIREFLDKHWSTGLGERGYALAANFTAYLVHANGMEPYVALLKASDRNQTRASFEKAFEQAMGMTLDEAIADYDTLWAWKYCDGLATQYWSHACAQPGLSIPPGTETYFDLDISCADPEVAGPSLRVSFDGIPTIWRDITVEFSSENQFFQFEAPMDGESGTATVEIRPCTTDCTVALTSTVRWSLGPDGEASFPSVIPGRSVIRVSRAADDPGPVRFRWYQPGS
ncbi:hypothetical protein [Nannocystis radixulma]|uniref:Ig-like domain-containing protein n=1 Tax=Nannocystis radixulma TaxID=2995305 RepID=A0ABT5B6R2_9BACT|nr:hypothetical protein [Nannocystis radixulma]MDC0669355.1 hypothetical protein [Nannocystis radixulma]